MADVYANGRSILHKGHGKMQVAIAPDVCKTPSPAGPVPIPYPNMSSDSNLTKGAKTVLVDGNPAANTGSKLSRSNGDEAGTAGGLVSSKNMGSFGWPSGSLDVSIEGKPAVRLLDPSMTNGNTYNDAGVNAGETGLVYGDDARCPRPVCNLDHDLDRHRVPETVAVGELCSAYVAELEATAPSRLIKRSRYGRMVAVAVCECGTEWRAVSGLPEALPPGIPGEGLCTEVVVRPGDDAFANIRELNPLWSCAAAKIASNAGPSHRIVAMSEKWIGKKRDGARLSKTFSVGRAVFAVGSGGGAALWRRQIPDEVRGHSGEPIPSGGSVPSCGTCQVFLPALVCEMDPC